MRLISQDNIKDIPYERTYLAIDIEHNRIVAADSPVKNSDGTAPIIVMAKYSSSEKAKKVMEMLHNDWCDYGECGLFMFPKDSEVEV